MGRLSTVLAHTTVVPGARSASNRALQRMALFWFAWAVVASASGAALAATASNRVMDPPAAVIDGVVMPAWLERSGRRQPVFPGMVLQERDRIVTGANARILLTLPEGSQIKLGESAQLGFDSLMAQREGGSIFLKSALSVVTGAFRFTTNALFKANSRRDVNIRLATVTAGIRGTDLWGKQAGAREVVCLLEGTIEVARDPVAGQSSAPLVLDQPLQFYIAPKDEPALPIGRVEDAQLALWAAETEIAPDAGAARVSGRWKVTLDGQTTFAGALALYEDLRQQGYAAQFRPDRKDGQRIYRVELGNLSTEGDARALATRLGRFGDAVPRVGRQ